MPVGTTPWYERRLPEGGVPKWLRERSAKPRCSGSNPLAASHFFWARPRCRMVFGIHPAGVVKPVDTRGLKLRGVRPVRVRVPPPALESPDAGSRVWAGRDRHWHGARLVVAVTARRVLACGREHVRWGERRDLRAMESSRRRAQDRRTGTSMRRRHMAGEGVRVATKHAPRLPKQLRRRPVVWQMEVAVVSPSRSQVGKTAVPSITRDLVGPERGAGRTTREFT